MTVGYTSAQYKGYIPKLILTEILTKQVKTRIKISNQYNYIKNLWSNNCMKNQYQLNHNSIQRIGNQTLKLCRPFKLL